MAIEGGIWLDILTRLNMASVDKVLKDVKTLMKEGGETSGESFSEALSATIAAGSREAFNPLAEEADSAFRQMQIGMAELQRSEAAINDLRARNFKTTTDAMINAQHQLDLAIANSQRLMSDATRANAAYRDGFTAVPLGERGAPGEREPSRGNNRAVAPERAERNSAAEFATGAAAEGIGERIGRGESGKNAQESANDIGREVVADRFSRHVEEGAAGAARIGGLGSILGLVGAGAYGTRSNIRIEQNLAQLRSLQGESPSNVGLISQATWKQAVETGYNTDEISKLYPLIERATNPLTGGRYRGQEAIQIGDTALQLARVANIHPDVALQGLTTSLFNYHTGPGGATGMANLIASGLAGFKGNATDYFEAQHTIEPVAEMAGIKAPEVFGMLDIMSQTGQSAQQSGQSGRNLIKSLARPNSMVSAAMQQLGLNPEDMSVYLSQNGIGDTLGSVLQAIGKDQFGPNGSVVLGAMANKPLMQQQQQILADKMSPKAREYIQSDAFQKSLVSGFKARNLIMKAGGQGLSNSDMPLIEQWLTDQKKMMGASDVLRRNQPMVENMYGAFGQAFGSQDAAQAAIMLAGSPEALQSYKDRTGQLGGAQNNPNAFTKSFQDAMAPQGMQWKKLGQQLGELAGRLGNDLLPVIKTVTQKFESVLGWLDQHKDAQKVLVDAMLGLAGLYAAQKLKLTKLAGWGGKKLWENFKPNALGGYGPVPELKGGGVGGGAVSGEGAATAIKSAGESAAASMSEGIVKGSNEGAEVFSGGIATSAKEAAEILSGGVVSGAKEAAPSLTAGVTEGGKGAGEAISKAMISAGAEAGREVGAGVEAASAGIGGKIAGAMGPALAGIMGSQFLSDLENRYDKAHPGQGNPGQAVGTNPLLQLGPTLWNGANNFIDGKPVTTDIFGWHQQWVGGQPPPPKPPGRAHGGIIGFAGGGSPGSASQPLMDVPDTGGDSVLGMLPNGQPVGLRGGEGILTPEATEALGGEEGISQINKNPWSNPAKVATTFYGSFAKGVAKYSPWGKYLTASAQSLESLEEQHEKAGKEQQREATGYFAGVREMMRGQYGSAAKYMPGYYGMEFDGYHSKDSYPKGPSGGKNVARMIYDKALAHGYSPQDATSIVAYSIGESGLNPGISGGVQGDGEVIGLFQEKSGFFAQGGGTGSRADAASNIDAYLNNLDRHEGSDIDYRLLNTSVGGPMYTGGKPAMDNLRGQAVNALGFSNPYQAMYGSGYAKGGVVGFDAGGRVPGGIGRFNDRFGRDDIYYHDSWVKRPTTPWGWENLSDFYWGTMNMPGDVMGHLERGPGQNNDFLGGGQNSGDWMPKGGWDGLPGNLSNRAPWPTQGLYDKSQSNSTSKSQYESPITHGGIDGIGGGLRARGVGYSTGGVVKGYAGGGLLGGFFPQAPAPTPGPAPAPAPAPTPAPADPSGVMPPGWINSQGNPTRQLPHIPGDMGKQPKIDPQGPHPFDPLGAYGSGKQPKKPGHTGVHGAINPQAIPGGTAPNQNRNIMDNPSRTLTSEGKGFGIGGGLIGMAESAAAGMGGPFGAAAQPAFQLINRAIGYGGQLVGIGIKGLMETFLPNDSPAADPSKNIFGKIALGIAGAHPGGGKNAAGSAAMQLHPKQDLDAGAMTAKQTPGIHVENIHNHSGDHQETFKAITKAANFGGITAASIGVRN